MQTLRNFVRGTIGSAMRSPWALALCLILGSASLASAQTPVIVGSGTVLQWDETSPVAGFTATQAQSLVYAVTVDATTPPTVITLSGVTCVSITPTAPDLSANTCHTAASVLPLGSHSITMTAASGSTVSLPSSPYAYVDIVIPVPKNVKLQ